MPRPSKSVYKPLNAMTMVVVALYGLMGLGDFASLGISIRLIRWIAQIQAGVDVDDALVEQTEALEGAVGIFQLVLLIPFLVALLAWIYRAGHNAQALEGVELDYSPGWCAASFLIPIMNLFRPYQAVKEIMQYSTISNLRPKSRDVPGMLAIWWCLVLGSQFFGRYAAIDAAHAKTLDAISGAYFLEIIRAVIHGSLCVVGAWIVRRVQSLQELKLEKGPAESANRTCPGCGEPVGETASACPLCGHELAPAFQLPWLPPSPSAE